MGEADSDLKQAFRTAHNRAMKRVNPRVVPESPIASVLDIEVNTTITEEELKLKILKFEAQKPGFMRASYKGCCLSECSKGFPKFYKAVLGSMLNAAQKKTLRKQAERKRMMQEVENNEVIQAAICIFKPAKIETVPIKRKRKRRRKPYYWVGDSMDSVLGENDGRYA